MTLDPTTRAARRAAESEAREPSSPAALAPSVPGLSVRPVRSEDLGAVAAIYDEAIAKTTATFDTEPVGMTALARKLASAHPLDIFLVAELSGKVVGYALSSAFRERGAFDGTREVSVYISPAAQGKQVATALYAELLSQLDAAGCHSQIALIASPNPGSRALHTTFGFQPAGLLRDAGFKFDRWIDLEFWQRMTA